MTPSDKNCVACLTEPVAAKVKAKRERTHGWSPNAWHTLKIEPMRQWPKPACDERSNAHCR